MAGYHYDGMSVLATQRTVTEVCTRSLSTSSYRPTKILLHTIFGWTRLAVLVVLLIRPATCSPVHRGSSSGSSSSSRQQQHRSHSSYYRSQQPPRPPLADSSISAAVAKEVERYLRQMDGENNRDQPDNVAALEANKEIVSSESLGSPGRSRRQAPHWSQPCSNLINDTDQNTTAAALSDHIINSVVRAMHHLNTFRNEYARNSLDMSWEDALNNTPTFNMEFINIPQVPEDKSHLDFDETLSATYEQMQRLAVGIEQVTLDQALYDSDFLQEFRTVEGHIVKILCQLHFAMIHRQVKPQVNITREIMSERYRDLSTDSLRKFRDITILREYKEGLKYANEIFSHFHTNDPQN